MRKFVFCSFENKVGRAFSGTHSQRQNLFRCISLLFVCVAASDRTQTNQEAKQATVRQTQLGDSTVINATHQKHISQPLFFEALYRLPMCSY